jgi:hypothetical protein
VRRDTWRWAAIEISSPNEMKSERSLAGWMVTPPQSSSAGASLGDNNWMIASAMAYAEPQIMNSEK